MSYGRYNIFRNENPLLPRDVTYEEAKIRFEKIKNKFLENKVDIVEEKDSFNIKDIKYSIRLMVN